MIPDSSHSNAALVAPRGLSLRRPTDDRAALFLLPLNLLKKLSQIGSYSFSLVV
jgi:hypothetical protein